MKITKACAMIGEENVTQSHYGRVEKMLESAYNNSMSVLNLAE